MKQLVSYDTIEQKLPVFGEFDEQIFNPYSDLNLGITPSMTSFAPKENLYDSLLKTPQQTTVIQTTSNNTKPIQFGDRRQYVKNWLIQNEGLSNEQASALTGVWYAESRLDPSIHEIGKESNPYAGKGIAQWTGKQRQQHAEDIYKRINGKSKPIKQMSLDEQLKVAITEFKERTGNWNAFTNAKDLNTATDIVWRGYENGGNNKLATMNQMKQVYRSNADKQWRERIRFAQQISNI